jgi:cytochrome c peroxidase
VYSFTLNKSEQANQTGIVELGKKLFFDKALSLDSSISCASCHKPEYAFADTVAFSKGVGGRLGLRNAPSVMNVASRELMFYDGRALNIEDQVHFPIEDSNEMNLKMEVLLGRLNRDKEYRQMFMNVFGREADADNLAKAIAAFEKSLETSNTPFDDYMSDKPHTLSESAIRGRDLFLSDRSHCFDCHFGPDFTGDEFRNIGLYNGKERNDKGRFEVSRDSSDLGKFRVPGLRNVGVTAPYMHDGSFKTLKDVIEYYSDPLKINPTAINTDSLLLKPLNFTEQEKEDLLSFLLSLSDRQFRNR